MEAICPLRLADKSWDNVGLLVDAPFPRQNANSILLTIDLTPAVLSEIKANGNIGAVIAYHPVIFRPLKRLSGQASGKDRALLECMSSGISIYCPHTALDACENGINDWLISGFEPGKDGTLVPIIPTSDSEPKTGMGRMMELTTAISISDAVETMKKHLNLKYLRLAKSSSAETMIKSVAVCAGSGSSVLMKAGKKVDLWVTGEMSHHELLAAVDGGTHVILCEHTNSERGYLEKVLAPRLRQLFSHDDQPVQIVTSLNDRDPVEIV